MIKAIRDPFGLIFNFPIVPTRAASRARLCTQCSTQHGAVQQSAVVCGALLPPFDLSWQLAWYRSSVVAWPGPLHQNEFCRIWYLVTFGVPRRVLFPYDNPPNSLHFKECSMHEIIILRPASAIAITMDAGDFDRDDGRPGEEN